MRTSIGKLQEEVRKSSSPERDLCDKHHHFRRCDERHIFWGIREFVSLVAITTRSGSLLIPVVSTQMDGSQVPASASSVSLVVLYCTLNDPG